MKSAAIDVVEAAVASKTKERWQYATWQVKVNLIYDMRFGGAGIGGFSEERKEDAVITILRRARHDEEFRKIVRGIEKPDVRSGRDEIKIDEILDFNQQEQFDKLKNQFNCRG
ncbi:MAG: hypothetical protein GF398_01670 [Chitinivibrionales bacterium]|nr:hypothetical protein [Chitinivibrionales bacterium]